MKQLSDHTMFNARTLCSAVLWVLAGLGTGYFLSTILAVTLLQPGIFIPPSTDRLPQTQPTSQDMDRELPPVSQLSIVDRPTRDKQPDGPGEVRKISEKTVDPSPSKLPLELKGTMTGPRGYRFAMIHDTEKEETRRMRPGESWDSMRLEAIFDQRVHVWNKQRDQREIIYLRNSEPESINNSSNSPSGSKEQNVQTVHRYQINEAIQYNMNNLLASVDVTPHVKNGTIVGFELKQFDGAPGKLAERLGFQQGDVITRVNGNSIDSMEKAIELWSQLRNQSNFRVTILRDGETREFRYELLD